ncbi:MAG: hypothetical protein Q4C00_06790 [Bacillota bacterium]|nr:hypothetical protein [Bacillota bacterium]
MAVGAAVREGKLREAVQMVMLRRIKSFTVPPKKKGNRFPQNFAEKSRAKN